MMKKRLKSVDCGAIIRYRGGEGRTNTPYRQIDAAFLNRARSRHRNRRGTMITGEIVFAAVFCFAMVFFLLAVLLGCVKLSAYAIKYIEAKMKKQGE